MFTVPANKVQAVAQAMIEGLLDKVMGQASDNCDYGSCPF